MSLVSLIPPWARYGAVAALAAAATWYGPAQVQKTRLEARIATIQGDRQAELQAASDAAYQASEAYRLAEQAWAQKLNEVIADAQTQRQAAALAAARAAAADATAGRLRGQLDAFTAAVRRRATEDPGPAGGGTTTGTALDLLAELFRRADARAGELARYADDARIAGLACERSYDVLSLAASSMPTAR